MTRQIRRSFRFGLLVFLLIAATSLFVRYFIMGVPVVTYRDELVSCGTVRRPLAAIAVHSGSEYFIRIDGRTYRRVRGLQPFYLRLHVLNAILFVTNEGDDKLEFHIVKLSDQSEITITAEKLSFGTHIGDLNPPGSPYTDYVDSEKTNEIILATSYPLGRKRVFLDLKERIVTKVEDDVMDESGHTLQHDVYLYGRKAQ